MEKVVKLRDYQAALDAVREQFEWERITIYPVNGNWDQIKMGVNWAALGTVPPEQAAEYANRILDAARAAENFVYNGYLIDYKR